MFPKGRYQRMSQQASYQIKTSELVKVVASGWLGTAMEFMDFQLYSLAAAIVFNEIFFPESDPAMGLIMAMGTYGAGYVARLVGAFGLGAGAEISGAGVMVTEFCETKTRGLVGSLVGLGTSSGTLLANLIWTIILTMLTKEEVLLWGWRIPFYASFVVMIAAVLIRMFVHESPVMAEKKKLLEAEREKQLAGDVPVEQQPKKGRKSFIVALALRFGQAGNSGLMQTYLAGFIVTVLAMEKTVATEANIISSCISFFTIPFVGWLGDKFGRRKMYMFLSLATAIYAVPMMLLFETKDPVILTIAMVIGLNVGVQGLFALENVVLTTMVSLAKEIAGLVATGFGPIIAAAAVTAMTGSWVPLAVMTILFSMSSFFGAYFSEDTTGRDLNELDDAM